MRNQKLNKNNHWKGGRTKLPLGYIKIKQPEHPNADAEGYVYEHRIILEKHLGRYLKHAESIHHINEDRSDNRINNLVLFKNSAYHSNYHRWNFKDKKYIIFNYGRLS